MVSNHSAHPQNIAIIGANGALGGALIKQLSLHDDAPCIHAFSRGQLHNEAPGVKFHGINYEDEYSIEQAAGVAAANGPLDLVLVAVGILHQGEVMPEKSLKDLSAEKFQQLFAANTIAPALIAKHFLPKLNRNRRTVFAALSARVGSISDNRLGGWYAYRASKAALNMVIKNAAIETARSCKHAIVVGLHPGTVDSNLSKPFQNNVPESQLFTADYSAQKLLAVLEQVSPADSGKCFAWDGQEIEP